MKRYSDLMKNGVVKCSVEKCSFNAEGICCCFASANEDDKKNTVCLGKIPAAKSEPLHIGYFRSDFSEVSSERLREYAEMLEELSYCVDTSSSGVTDAWKVMSRFASLVRSELSDRESAERDRAKERQKRRKKGLPVSQKKMIKPVKAAKRRI